MREISSKMVKNRLLNLVLVSYRTIIVFREISIKTNYTVIVRINCLKRLVI